MALRDVKEYYYTMLGQYVEVKEDLKDFDEALQAGHFTEEQVADAKAEVARLKENVDRIQYIMYLFELPNRKKKQPSFKKANAALERYFSEIGADVSAVADENKSILAALRATLEKLKKQ